MPPIRTITTKPIKTERTHEENQERAYIAASRRSDRSLEARVESARRASEIHKRRTGRSLRVTEQDVINEEMYEEEDDDLPLQYRRLTAHLNTNSPDFNRRLAAYLTNHVAMRNALGQAINTSYAQQPQMPQMWNQQPMQNFQQPWMANNQMNQPMMQQQQPQFQTPMMMQPQMMQNHSPTNYRQTPYPIPPSTYRPNVQRSTTNAVSQDAQSQITGQQLQQSPTQVPIYERRATMAGPSIYPTSMTMPQDNAQGLQSSQRNSSSQSLPNLATSNVSPAKKASSLPPTIESPAEPLQQAAPASALSEHASQSWSPLQPLNMSPLSSNLPPEAQMFMPNNFNTNAMYQASMEKVQQPLQPFYSYNPNNIKPRGMHPSYDGMNQTLAPGALDNLGTDGFNWPTPPSATTESVNTPFTPSFSYGLDSLNPADGFLQKPLSADGMSFMQPGSGLVTPGEAEWASFIDPNSWSDPSVA